jgi:hypothetical protein
MRWRGATRRRPREAALPDVPQTGGYMVAAYVVTAVILVGYAVALYRRGTKL